MAVSLHLGDSEASYDDRKWQTTLQCVAGDEIAGASLRGLDSMGIAD